jgi:quinohemoprotein amine dehydrogenase
MASTSRIGKGRFTLSRGLVCCLAGSLTFCTVLAAQEEGIPVANPLVIAKCGSCHTSDARGNMQRISWARTTPESWQDVLKQMILLHGLSVTPSEARDIVKYLSSTHGLSPEEARPVMYDPERRVHEETDIPSESLRDTCTKCHSFARALSWRRSPADWREFAESHAARYKTGSIGEAVEFLSSAAPLHTPAWDVWNSRASKQDLAGRWLVAASVPGHGNYYGEMQIDRAGDGEFNTHVNLTSVKDGSRVFRSGRSAVFGDYAWRGRSRGTGPASSAPDDPGSEAREVLLIAPDQSTAVGRWFWGQYQEFEFNVRLWRASSDPTLIGEDRSSLRTGSVATRMRLTGDNFPGQVAPADLDFGPGVTVSGIVSHSPSEIVAEVDVAADARLGKHDVAFRRSVLPDALAIFDRIDYIRVTPDSIVSAFGDRTHPRGYQQFEAIGYQRGADGKLHTADDVALGPVNVSWTVQVFHEVEGSSSGLIGTMSPAGLFTPAADNPNINFDTWVVATATGENDQKDKPLVGKSYMVVTIPTYTINGRQYVRELGRWVDDGPASGK